MSAPLRNSPPAPPRVVIVDADRRVQASLADLLRIGGELDVVGGAGDVRTALELVERERPDAILVDPRLPDVEAGMALIGGLRRAWPGLRVVLTGWADRDATDDGTQPPNCYVSKSASPEAFADAIINACREPRLRVL